jgi:hypothetical protein
MLLTIQMDLNFCLLPGSQDHLYSTDSLAGPVRCQTVGPGCKAAKPKTSCGIGPRRQVSMLLGAVADRHGHARHRDARGVHDPPCYRCFIAHFISNS